MAAVGVKGLMHQSCAGQVIIMVMLCVQCLSSVEAAADVQAAECVQAELALVSDVSTHSQLMRSSPSRQHDHRMSPSIVPSQVTGN